MPTYLRVHMGENPILMEIRDMLTRVTEERNNVYFLFFRNKYIIYIVLIRFM